MSRSYKLVSVVAILISVCLLIGCKKNWLDAKPDISLAVPSTIPQFQALIDYPLFVTIGGDGGLDEVSSGDLNITDATFNNSSPTIGPNAYIWASKIFDINSVDETLVDWTAIYQKVFYANIVLEGIDKLQPTSSAEQLEWNNVKGTAFFLRAYSHFRVATEFCKVYDRSTAESDLGVPLKLESDINIVPQRSSLQKSYDQIIGDLEKSLELLPRNAPIGPNDIYRTRPTKAAANAMLARVYLAMREYDKAFDHAELCLQLYNKLIDYNTNPPVDLAATNPFTASNEEVLFNARINNYSDFFNSSRLIVDSNLFKLYTSNDIRKRTFFRVVSGNNTTKGTYTGASVFFTGLATDEVYLIRAECYARRGDIVPALQDLNTLYRKRWDNLTGPFVPLNATTADEALHKILIERRKELCFRGIRWSDLKRLNKEPGFETTLKRVVNGQTFLLEPNSPRYALSIPPNTIILSGIQQNPR